MRSREVVGRRERNGWGRGITTEGGGKGLYERTGYPQPVQGKRGENLGESRIQSNLFIFNSLQCLRMKKSGTRILV